ncbi:mandelate racemase/muconate lactonizing enzyme family protein [Natronomonas sp. F2-12]|uniref:Mandelate racemase/muconate lactonizing enzyme family protein n=1 Tax=Natronomonas aquatica TaxID=2841590 RepID=A0A9R1CTH8_9EURY|nr:mandelate racemase/muconate lactonizing enzyme family protein [Natronomonas aquatica]MCQ4333635.1 mandelate racemase/muconate lactonizing enzyme family protein [Natronomonas aquatica]
MEITATDAYALHQPIDRTVGDQRLEVTDVYWIVVEIDTDEGYTGTGWMGSLGFAPETMLHLTESQFLDPLIGADPFATETIRERLRSRSVYYGELGLSAWPRGAIDVALWDIKAQASGQPLYRLLGGSDTELPAYVSSMDSHHDLSELADLHGGYAEEGFTAFKTKVGSRSPDREAERIREIRAAVGDDAELFVDANQAWTVKEAIETSRAMNEHDISWVEEPISEFDLDGHGKVAEAIGPPLATGEMLNRPEQFTRLLERGGMEVAQPDLIRSGGVTGQLHAAKLAADHGVPMASHFYYSVSAHVVSAASNGMIVEYIPEYDIAPMLENPPTVEDGTVKLPDRPGHGYRIDPDARDEHEVSFD